MGLGPIWSYGAARQQREEAALFLLIQHKVWPAKLAEAGALRLEGPNGERLDGEYLGKSPAEEVWTSVDWDRVAELVALEEPPGYANRSDWAVLRFAASLVTSPWSHLMGSVDDDNTNLMHGALAWARAGERAADPFLGLGEHRYSRWR